MISHVSYSSNLHSLSSLADETVALFPDINSKFNLPCYARAVSEDRPILWSLFTWQLNLIHVNLKMSFCITPCVGGNRMCILCWVCIFVMTNSDFVILVLAVGLGTRVSNLPKGKTLRRNPSCTNYVSILQIDYFTENVFVREVKNKIVQKILSASSSASNVHRFNWNHPKKLEFSWMVFSKCHDCLSVAFKKRIFSLWIFAKFKCECQRFSRR